MSTNAERVNAMSWYHTIDVEPGLTTPGWFDLRPYVDRYQLPDDMTGMRALDIHVVGAQDGHTPALARAAARGVLAVVFFLATFTAYTYVLGRYDTPLSTFHQVSRAACIAVASLAFVGHLWQLWDRDGRSLWDRLCGLAVIEDMVPVSMPDRLWSPWGT